MKADPDVKMISAEAPILFAKGCDIFITELTMRAWIHAEENKRRTLQRSDIASALAKSDMFDFLIDIVPREEAASHAKRATGATQPSVPPPGGSQLPPQSIPQNPGGHGHMPPPDYIGLSHQEPDYRQNMYTPQVQPGPAAPYGGAPGQQMYSDIEGIYGGYPPMQAQQVCHIPTSSFTMTDTSSKCTKCHSPAPKIRQSVKTQDITILVTMAEKAMLTQRASVTTKSRSAAFWKYQDLIFQSGSGS